MSNLLINPFLQVVDENGDPISGAKAYFYATGTTTEQAIYEDDDLTTPHDNPVIADSDGSFAAIYLDTTLVYKLVLKDADDVTIRTYDPVSAATSSVLYLKERAAADTDKAGYGQFWVKDDTPNTPWFTNDAGTDFQLATLTDTDGDSKAYWAADDDYRINIAGTDVVEFKDGLSVWNGQVQFEDYIEIGDYSGGNEHVRLGSDATRNFFVKHGTTGGYGNGGIIFSLNTDGEFGFAGGTISGQLWGFSNNVATNGYTNVIGLHNTGAATDSSYQVAKFSTAGTSAVYMLQCLKSSSTEVFGVQGNGNINIGGVLTPLTDDTHDIGTASFRYDDIYATNGTIQTSDERQKRNIQPIRNALPLARLIQPIRYKWKDVDEAEETETVTVEKPVLETVEVDDWEITVIDGKAIRRPIKSTVEQPVYDYFPMVDESGDPVIDKKGNPAFKAVRRMQTVTETRAVKPARQKTHSRTHLGFSAQNVKQAIEQRGIDPKDFAAFVEDGETGRMGLRSSELLPVLWQAVLELADEVERLKSSDSPIPPAAGH